MAEETRLNKAGSASDPRVRMVLVACGEVATLISMAAQQPQYGALKMPLFGTRDEALAYIRAQIKG